MSSDREFFKAREDHERRVCQSPIDSWPKCACGMPLNILRVRAHKPCIECERKAKELEEHESMVKEFMTDLLMKEKRK